MDKEPKVLFVEQFLFSADALLRSILSNALWDESLHVRLTASFDVSYSYTDGSSSMDFHADSILGLVPNTGVAIVSLGNANSNVPAPTGTHIRWSCPLPHGSLLYMPPEVQLEWQHGVLQQAGAGQRVSLTFRNLQ